MPLTPTDVANKQFRIAFRGYSLDEVDAFLDEVEAELSRLLRDNSELAQRPPEPAGIVPVRAAPPVAPEPIGLEGQEAALRTLLLAQRTADEAIAEARAEADEIVSAARQETEGARHEAGSVVAGARAEAEKILAAARAQADRLLEAANHEAEQLVSRSSERAARLDQELATQIEAATGDLEGRRTAIEARIEELRAFEREYRTRLQAYLTTQLRDLDGRAGADDAGAGVPDGAAPRAAAGVERTPSRRGPAQDSPKDPPRQSPGGAPAPYPSSQSGSAARGPFGVDPRGRQGGRDTEPPVHR